MELLKKIQIRQCSDISIWCSVLLIEINSRKILSGIYDTPKFGYHFRFIRPDSRQHCEQVKITILKFTCNWLESTIAKWLNNICLPIYLGQLRYENLEPVGAFFQKCYFFNLLDRTDADTLLWAGDKDRTLTSGLFKRNLSSFQGNTLPKINLVKTSLAITFFPGF